MKTYIALKPLSLAYKLLLILAGAVGLAIQIKLFSGRIDLSPMKYFTLMSNLLCTVYFTADLIWLLPKRRAAGEALCPLVKGMAAFGVMMTWLIAHFLLGSSFSMGSAMGFSVVLLHYAAPIMAIADWLLFDRKGMIRPVDPLLWALFPIAYLVFAFTGAELGMRFYSGRYPYPFMDVDKLGVGRVALTIAILFVIFIALGYLYYAIDALVARAARKKAQ